MRFEKQKDYPKTVRVGNAVYKVVFKRKVLVGKEECLGACDPSTKCLEILQGLEPTTRLDTFIHEWLHAVEHEAGIELGHSVIDKLEAPVARLLEDLMYKS